MDAKSDKPSPVTGKTKRYGSVFKSATKLPTFWLLIYPPQALRVSAAESQRSSESPRHHASAHPAQNVDFHSQSSAHRVSPWPLQQTSQHSPASWQAVGCP